MPALPPNILADLHRWLATGRPMDDTPPARLAVIGDPIAHSRSPAMHQPALDAHGLDMRYIRLHIRPGEVADAFAAMRALGFVGCNVTVPHKAEALAACDHVSPSARLFGAVNTVRFEADGSISGSNTDGPGLAAAVHESFGLPLSAHRVAIIGAGGGAGRAAALQCALDNCAGLVLVNRTTAKAGAVAAEIAATSPALPIRIVAIDDTPELRAALASCTLLVQATTVGMRPDDPSPIDPTCLHPALAVFDMIYTPPETRLLAAARALGAPAANGLAMLIHQGALSFATWFGTPPPVAIMRQALAAQD